MRAVDERLTFVETQAREQKVMIDGLREALTGLRGDMNRQFAAVDRRFEAVDRRLDLMDAKISRQFVWLVGVQVMTLAAVVTSLATILGAISGR